MTRNRKWLLVAILALLAALPLTACHPSGCIPVCPENGPNCPLWQQPGVSARYYVEDDDEWRSLDNNQVVGYSTEFWTTVWWPTRWCAITNGHEMFPPDLPDTQP